MGYTTYLGNTFGPKGFSTGVGTRPMPPWNNMPAVRRTRKNADPVGDWPAPWRLVCRSSCLPWSPITARKADISLAISTGHIM